MKRLVLLFFCVVLGALFGELVAWFLAPPAPLISHPLFNHIWAPNTTIVHHEATLRQQPVYSRVTNSLGWLYPGELPLARSPVEERVFFLGDSFTEGTVPEEESMPFLVGERLKIAREKNGLTVIPVNVGTSSHSPLLHYLRYREEIRQFHPHSLVVSVDMTDAFDDYVYEQSCIFSPSGIVERCPPSSSFSTSHQRIATGLRRISGAELMMSMLARGSNFADILYSALWRAPHYHDTPDPDLPQLFDWCTPGNDARAKHLNERTAKYLGYLIRDAVADGVDVCVTGIPHFQHFNGEWSHTPFETIRTATQSAGAKYVNSLEGIQNRLSGTNPRELYFANDFHFNTRGNSIWSGVISDGCFPNKD
jgi:hypothetical protein